MFRRVAITAVLALLVACARVPLCLADAVLIDQTQAAYTVYAGIPQDKVEAVKEKLAKAPPGLALVPWETFTRNRDRYIKARIVKDEYPGLRTVDGVVALVRKFPGTPIGLTWNGGIAITYNDYQYTKRIYGEYRTDPAAYERTRNRDPRRDPINPKAHLGPLLGW